MSRWRLKGRREDELDYPPRRPREPIFDRVMIRRIWHSTLVMGGAGFVVFYWLLTQGYAEATARNLLLLLFVLFENFQTFNSRSERHSVFRQSLVANPLLVSGVVGAQALHVGAMHVPVLSETLSLEPVDLKQWTLLLVVSSSLVVAMEIEKWCSADQHKEGEVGIGSISVAEAPSSKAREWIGLSRNAQAKRRN